jgi:hypothetical protein
MVKLGCKNAKLFLTEPLRYYLDFCQRCRFSESNSRSLPNFIRKLKEKGQTDVQQKQAGEAIYKLVK